MSVASDDQRLRKHCSPTSSDYSCIVCQQVKTMHACVKKQEQKIHLYLFFSAPFLCVQTWSVSNLMRKKAVYFKLSVSHILPLMDLLCFRFTQPFMDLRSTAEGLTKERSPLSAYCAINLWSCCQLETAYEHPLKGKSANFNRNRIFH